MNSYLVGLVIIYAGAPFGIINPEVNKSSHICLHGLEIFCRLCNACKHQQNLFILVSISGYAQLFPEAIMLLFEAFPKLILVEATLLLDFRSRLRVAFLIVPQLFLLRVLFAWTCHLYS